MDKKNPLRGEERRVISTKLYRSEFANFKKLCDREGKTVNKKLRELINLEIGQKFGANENNDLGKLRKFFIPSENRVLEMIEMVGGDEK